MTRQCLIFSNYALKVTDGGPSGFLAQNLAGTSSSHYRVSAATPPVEKSRWRRAWNHRFGDRLALKKLGLPPGGWYQRDVLSARHRYVSEHAADFGWIWFHDVISLGACLDLIPSTQQVIFQPHCPDTPSQEQADYGASSGDLGWLRHAEQKVFQRANVCVLPNKFVRPIYESLLTPATRVEYLMSGSRQLEARSSLPLDPRQIYFLFLGRRLPVKGFDLLMEAFAQAHRQNDALRLLVVGRGETLRVPGVIDIGFSEDPASWYAACDYLVSANRQSYFDLSVMEALSLGTPLIVTATGGHRQFADLVSPGVTLVPELKPELLAGILVNSRTKRAENVAAVADNQRIYQARFAVEKYRRRLDELLQGLIEAKVGG